MKRLINYNSFGLSYALMKLYTKNFYFLFSMRNRKNIKILFEIVNKEE